VIRASGAKATVNFSLLLTWQYATYTPRNAKSYEKWNGVETTEMTNNAPMTKELERENFCRICLV
jgi:hypothetical protein